MTMKTLSFSKERVRVLVSGELDQVQGGVGPMPALRGGFHPVATSTASGCCKRPLPPVRPPVRPGPDISSPYRPSPDISSPYRPGAK
jgi:hypothetical protein